MITWRLGTEVQIARERDGTILFNLQNGQLYSLTPVGSVILDRLLGGREMSAVIDELEEAYGQPRARLESDARRFMHELVEKGLCHAGDQ
jgi:hypothetical protein